MLACMQLIVPNSSSERALCVLGREALIANLLSGDDKLILAALSVFVSLLQNEGT